jgi:hypothetical protein
MVYGLCCRVWVLGFRVQGLRFKGLGVGVQFLGLMVENSEFGVQGSGLRI